MLPRLTTARLTLEPVSTQDLPSMVELNGDPEVMHYLKGRAATPAETDDEWAERLSRRTNVARGLGYWAGSDADGFCGWWAASHFAPDREVAMIGYRVMPRAWGRGLATEGAQAVMTHAWTVPDVQLARAATMALNAESRRVMEKLGMTHVATEHAHWFEAIEGSEHGDVVYELRRDEAARRRNQLV